ncbi:uncharacterized protein [Centruroides vittatus]|uniref:uncharacterized protein n=1 Tax=Centruroides vittatus TaxID=120091 RepID=UPI00350F5215
MKVSKLSTQATDLENNIFKLSKCNKLSKTKSTDKTRNIKKTNILKSLDCVKAIKKSKKENIKCVVTTGKKRKCSETNEPNSKSKECKRFANNVNYSIKENIKKQFNDTDKLKLHNYSKSAKECKYQENSKKKAKLKQQILNVKNSKFKKQHSSNVTNEKKQKSHSKGLKEKKGKLSKHKDHNLKLNKKSKMKRNHLKESKQSCLNIQNKISNKSLYEQLSKMKLSSGSSSDKDVPIKKKKEVICNGSLYSPLKKTYKEKQQSFIPSKKLKCRTFEENIPPQENLSSVSSTKTTPTSTSRCHRVASLNAIAKVHILFENEFRNSSNNEKKEDTKRKLSTSFLKHNVATPKQELDKKAGKEIKAKVHGKKNAQHTKNMNIVSTDKGEELNKEKSEENDLNGTRRSKRMASMNAQAILAVTCSLRPRRKSNKVAIPEHISVSSTESDMTEIQVKWSSEKVHQEVNNKSNSSTSYHQSKVVIMGVRSTRTLKADQLNNHLKDMKKSKSKLGKKKPVRKDDDNLVQNNLCSYHAVASNNNMAVSRLGLTKYTKVTKVHINTKGMDLKSPEDSNLHEIEQGEMAVMSTYRYQTKDSCYHHWRTMFSKPVPGQLSNQTDADCSGCYLTNPTHTYSYPANSGSLSIPGVGADEARDCCINGCDPTSSVPCNVDRCNCQQNDPYFQRIIDPFCNNKSVYPAQPSCLTLQQQNSNLTCCSGEQSVPQETHHASTCTRQERLCSVDQCHQQLSNFQTHYTDASNPNNQSCQQTYPNRYSYNVHCHRACQLHKFSFPCHGCTTPNHIHRSHLHSCLNYQKALSSHSQDICPPAPHSPNPPLAAPTSDSAASLAAKVPRPELLMPQEANLPTEGKLSIEDGSYKYCLVCENDRNIKCVPSSRSSLLNQDSLNNSESLYFNSTTADKQRLRSIVEDIQLSQSGKINNCKFTNEKVNKKHQLENKHPSRKSFKFLKLNQKWRRSESPEDDIPLCNLNKQQVSTGFSQLDNGTVNEDLQKSTKRHRKQTLSKFSNHKKLCNKDSDSTCVKLKKLEEIIPKLTLHSSIPRRIGKTKYSNGWSWEGEPFEKLVLLNNDDIPRLRKCYSAMRHVEGDVIRVRDCVLLKSGPRKADLPYVAKVVALWENFEDGEMMLSLLWYYRPEHTDQGRKAHHMEDEIFASKHRDINSVACIEDKCYVLTFGEYCRYRAWLKMLEEGTRPKVSPVPDMEECYIRKDRLPPGRVSSEMIFFCHKVYDFRQRRILKNPT